MPAISRWSGEARLLGDVTVSKVSIFVNRLQFALHEDSDSYLRTSLMRA
jgi:pantothenate synthetase